MNNKQQFVTLWCTIILFLCCRPPRGRPEHVAGTSQSDNRLFADCAIVVLSAVQYINKNPSANKQTASILYNLNVRFRVHKSSALVPIFRQKKWK